MQMHIKDNENRTKILFTDNTLVARKIDKSIKIYKWDFLLPSFPKGSFLVGGYIRDLLLNRLNESLDVDIVVPRNAIKIGKNISREYNGKYILLDKEREVVRIIFEGLNIDIAAQTSKLLNNDLFSRDFTINSIAFSFDSREIIDPTNGINDINKSLLRTYSDKNILDDPLRILRCFRFNSEINFDIDLELLEFIKINKNALNQVSSERIQYEIKKIIKGKEALRVISTINKLKIFSFLQSYENYFVSEIKTMNRDIFQKEEIEKFLPIVFLNEILDLNAIKQLRFSRSVFLKSSLLMKWRSKLIKKSISHWNEIERFNLHKDLEDYLPAFISYLPKTFQLEWITRWRDMEDKLFHPSNLINGDNIKKYLPISDGPLLGSLLDYLSMELAYDRVLNFDDAIYKAKQWFKQNAPKCD